MILVDTSNLGECEFETIQDALDFVGDQLKMGFWCNIKPDVEFGDPEDIGLDVLRDICLLAEEKEIPLDKLAALSLAQKLELERWAAATHLNASDNDDVEIPMRPVFLDGLLA